MPSPSSSQSLAPMATVKWMTKWIRKLDWLTRHEVLTSLLINREKLGESIVERLGQDECLIGKNTPKAIECVIPLPDAPRHRNRKRQTTLEHFGIVKRQR